MAGEFDVSDIPIEDTTAAKEISKSVLSPDYRAPRGAFGAQEIGGLLGGTPATSGFSYGQYGTGIDPSTGEYFGSLYF